MARTAERVDRATVVSARVAEHERHLIRAAAAQRDLPVSDWLRDTALDAARRVLSDDDRSD